MKRKYTTKITSVFIAATMLALALSGCGSQWGYLVPDAVSQ